MTFTHSKIKLADTGFFPQIMLDYMAGAEALRPFYQHTPGLEAFGEAMSAKAREGTDRSTLVKVLQEQLHNLTLTDAVKDNIQSLADDNTFCVVTAHQLNLATGPLYVIYKALSAISLCEQLEKQYPGKKLVPVFWLGSEDHDLDEVNHFHAFHKTYTWQTEQSGAVGRMLATGMDALWDSLAEDAGNSSEADAWVNMLRDCYRADRTMSVATTDLLNRIFGTYGLVILDGDHPAMKKACADIILDELQSGNSAGIVQLASEKLSRHYSVQAYPREINLFFLDNNSRDRITRVADGYELANSRRTFGAEELEELINTQPQVFSPNVILRPLFQQRVLPAVAYVGGAGELSYWMQLKTLFGHHGIEMPVLVLRDSVTLVDHTSCKKLQKLGLEPDAMFGDIEQLVKAYVSQQAGEEIDLEIEKKQLEKTYRSISEKAVKVDPTLEKAVAAEEASALKALEKLHQRLLKAEKQRFDVAINQLRSVHARMFPNGGLQERYDNLLPWLLRFGPSFPDQLLKVMDAPSDHLHILCEEPQA